VDYCYVRALSDNNQPLTFNGAACIGCGLCASHCPENAIVMVLREQTGKIYETANQFDSKIQREAIVGKIKSLVKL
jgi:Fe-S-cluster-containing hydrogenase component 2